MTYVGIQTQISRNNFNTVLLLIAFPVLLLAMVYAILFFSNNNKEQVPFFFLQIMPFVLIGVAVWFAIAYFANTAIIQRATGARALSRMENMRVYNLLENICISQGMRMPQLYVLDDDSLNAYASGINEKSFAITLSQGIIDKLNDQELEGVMAHELTHIKNRDVRLLIISIVFVGIFAFISQAAIRSLRFGSWGRRNKNNNAPIILVIIVVSIIAYFLSMLLRFAISRKREYMADAGAAEITRNPLALASALRKISVDPCIEAVKNEDVAQLFIDHPTVREKKSFSFNQLFATHPPIEKRIEVLEQF